MKNLQSTFSSLMLLGLKPVHPKLTGGKSGQCFANQVSCPRHARVKLGPTPPCNRCAQTGRLYICHRIPEDSFLIVTKTA